MTARTMQRTALLLALSVVLWVGLFCDPVQFWFDDLRTGLSTSQVESASAASVLPPYWHRQAPASCTEDSRCWIGSVNDSRSDAESLADWTNR